MCLQFLLHNYNAVCCGDADSISHLVLYLDVMQYLLRTFSSVFRCNALWISQFRAVCWCNAVSISQLVLSIDMMQIYCNLLGLALDGLQFVLHTSMPSVVLIQFFIAQILFWLLMWCGLYCQLSVPFLAVMHFPFHTKGLLLIWSEFYWTLYLLPVHMMHFAFHTFRAVFSFDEIYFEHIYCCLLM